MQDSAPKEDRREQRKDQEKEKDSKEHATTVVCLDTAQEIVGQEREKEEKEEHMLWSGRKEQEKKEIGNRSRKEKEPRQKE